TEFGFAVPSAPACPLAPWPARSVTRRKLTEEDATEAAMLDVPATVASGRVKAMSSPGAPPGEGTPVTGSGAAAEGELSSAVPPTYDQVKPLDVEEHDSPP